MGVAGVRYWGSTEVLGPGSAEDTIIPQPLNAGAGDNVGRFKASGSALLLQGHTSAVTRMRCPINTNLLLSASNDGTIRIWAAGRAEAVMVLVANSDAFEKPLRGRSRSAGTRSAIYSSPAASPASMAGSGSQTSVVRVGNLWADAFCSTVWAACSDGSLRVWDGAEGKELRYLYGHEEGVSCIDGIETAEYSAGSRGSLQGTSSVIASGSSDRTVRIWDCRARKSQVCVFRGHSDTVRCLRWGSGGRCIISGSKDRTVKIWDIRAGRLQCSLDKHFRFSPLILCIYL